jgi:hypothetical protein
MAGVGFQTVSRDIPLPHSLKMTESASRVKKALAASMAKLQKSNSLSEDETRLASGLPYRFPWPKWQIAL